MLNDTPDVRSAIERALRFLGPGAPTTPVSGARRPSR
jgi:hypothetical protein